MPALQKVSQGLEKRVYEHVREDVDRLGRHRTWDFGEKGGGYGFKYVAFDALEPSQGSTGAVDHAATATKYFSAASDFWATAMRLDKMRVMAFVGSHGSDDGKIAPRPSILMGAVGAAMDLCEIPHKVVIGAVYALAGTAHRMRS